MSPLTFERLIELLDTYIEETGHPVDLLLIGALALPGYQAGTRGTQDIDGEFLGDLDSLMAFLAARHIPADLGENISGWSVVAMPPGYRERASVLVSRTNLILRLLAPTDFIIAKLRRGTELDLQDASAVAKRFSLSPATIQAAGEAAIAASPKDTALFLFRKILDRFCNSLQS